MLKTKIKFLSGRFSYWLSVAILGTILSLSLQLAYAWVNPPTSGTPPGNANVGAPINTSQIGQVKDGSMMVARNPLTYIGFIVAKGNVGIGTVDPWAPLDFAASTGSKINLYHGYNYGLGIQNTLFQIYAPSAADRIGIGYGGSDSFTETLTVKGSNVGIGTANPVNDLGKGSALDIAGVAKAWRYYDDDANYYMDLNTQSRIKDLAMTGALNYQWGGAGAGKVMTSDSDGNAYWGNNTGPQGPQGPPGPQGPQGPQGPAGTFNPGVNFYNCGWRTSNSEVNTTCDIGVHKACALSALSGFGDDVMHFDAAVYPTGSGNWQIRYNEKSGGGTVTAICFD